MNIESFEENIINVLAESKLFLKIKFNNGTNRKTKIKMIFACP